LVRFDDGVRYVSWHRHALLVAAVGRVEDKKAGRRSASAELRCRLRLERVSALERFSDVYLSNNVHSDARLPLTRMPLYYMPAGYSLNESTGMYTPDNKNPGIGLAELTSGLVSSYVSNNSVSVGDLPNLIASVHASLSGLGAPQPELVSERPKPLMPIKKTVTPDYLVSLEDGRHYKSLKRHLTGKGLTPAQYREKWGLPLDYPMVAPSYAAKRSELARSSGLGRKREEAAKPAPAKRSGRRKAA
jgi:predicted transcriptional regulator